MMVLFPMVGIACLGWLLNRLWNNTDGNLRPLFLPVLTGKILFGLCFGCIYTCYYGAGDSIYQFSIANDLYLLAENNFTDFLRVLGNKEPVSIPTDPRSVFFIKIISVLNLIAAGNYWSLTVLLSIGSFAIIWLLATRINTSFNTNSYLLLFAMVFFPSIGFWTSGIVKETISFMAMCVLIWVIIPIYKERRFHITELTIGFLAFIVLWFLKYYHAALLIIFLVALLVYSILRSKGLNPLKIIVTTSLVLVCMLLIFSFSHYNMNLIRVLEVIVQNNALLTAKTDIGKSIVYDGLTPDITSLILNWPRAIYFGVYEPLPWNAWNLLSLIQSAEHLILLGLTLMALMNWKRVIQYDKALILFVIAYVVAMATLLGFSTPNYGTLSRYKVAYLPFLTYFLLEIIPIKQLIRKIRSGA